MGLCSVLEPQDREVILLRYYSGWTMARIGRRLRISESRVCRIHASILARLKRRLEPRMTDVLG